MTKEEYEKLLKSDYWKGYSYSLIKERNFKCEDCGIFFHNERHKLQVHHLVYRDANPWSYKPEELVVLCEKCHKKRHGIIDDIEIVPSTHNISESTNEYTKTYSYSPENKNANSTNKGKVCKNPHFFKFRKTLTNKSITAILFICITLYIFINISTQSENTDDNFHQNKQIVTEENKNPVIKNHTPQQNNKSTTYNSKKSTTPITKNYNSNRSINTPETGQNDIPTKEALQTMHHTTNETVFPAKHNIKEKTTCISNANTNTHIITENTSNSARQSKANTEGSTTDILERINRKHIEERAKEEGVSTEGSTTDILERINRKHIEKRLNK